MGVLEPVVAHHLERDLRRYFRALPPLANPEVREFLEAEGYKYTIRLPPMDAMSVTNSVNMMNY